MKRFVPALLAAWLFATLFAAAQTKTPRITTVDPAACKVGDVATAKGENLDKDVVADLYLTDGKNDVKTVITERASDSIKFKVPQIKAGRYRLMTGSKTAMVEQPVILEVSEP